MMPTNNQISLAIKKELEGAFSNKFVFSLAESQIAPFINAVINSRTERGEYLGGNYADKGYSTTPLPAFFFGNYTKSGRSYVFTDPSRDRGAVKMHESQLQWGRKTDGSKGSDLWVKGGYKDFRKASGRQVSKVTHSWSGELMRQLTSTASITNSGAKIVTAVIGSRGQIATWLDRKREFIGISDAEADKIADSLALSILNKI